MNSWIYTLREWIRAVHQVEPGGLPQSVERGLNALAMNVQSPLQWLNQGMRCGC